MKTAEETGATFVAEYSDCNDMQTTVNLQVLEQHRELLQSKKQILELGCGSGKIAYILAGKLPETEVLGTDKSESLINQAKTQYQRPNLTFEIMDVNSLSVKQQYDLIICFFLLHFIPQRNEVFKKMLEALNQNGDLLVIIPIEDRQMLEVRRAILRESAMQFFFQAPPINGICTDSEPYKKMVTDCNQIDFVMEDKAFNPKMSLEAFAAFYRGISVELRELKLDETQKDQHIQNVVSRMPKRSNGEVDFTLCYFQLSAKIKVSLGRGPGFFSTSPSRDEPEFADGLATIQKNTISL